MYEQKALHVHLYTGFYRVERLRTTEIIGPVDFGFREWARAGALCFGGGPFMGSILPGSNRLVVTGHSPCWDGFYVSTMGGAALTFENLGPDYVALTRPLPRRRRCWSCAARGRRRSRSRWRRSTRRRSGARPPTSRSRSRGSTRCSATSGTAFAGTFSTPPRVLAVGPAALATDFGAIGSSKVDEDGLDARRLLGRPRRPRAAAWRASTTSSASSSAARSSTSDLDDRKLADEYFQKRYSMRMALKDREATHQVPLRPRAPDRRHARRELRQAEGQAASSSTTARSTGRAPSGWRCTSAHIVAALPQAVQRARPSRPRSSSHCGEPCLAVCKKMRGPYKKDYEPYETMGPNLRHLRPARRRAGRRPSPTPSASTRISGGRRRSPGSSSCSTTASCAGRLGPGARRRSSSRAGFRAVEDSQHNADAGLRAAARHRRAARGDLDSRRGRARGRPPPRRSAPARPARCSTAWSSTARASAAGWCPNQYWVPGMFSPMPIMGKYYEYYGDDFVPPRALGRMNAERMVQELVLDNLGFCRFHREWAEELVPEIFRDFWQARHRPARPPPGARPPHQRAQRLDVLGVEPRGRARARLPPAQGRGGREAARSSTSGSPASTPTPGRRARDFWYEIRKGVDEALALD